MRILIVDDSVVFRSQIKAALEDIDGIEIAGSAANGRIALEKVEQGSIDVIILDLEMPEMNGLEMLQAMRTRGLRQTVIVFAAPSGDGAEAALAALRAGASDFISKPKNAGSLEAALEGVKLELVPKILQFKERVRKSGGPSAGPKPTPTVNERSAPATTTGPDRIHPVFLQTFKPRVVAIGSSTGGPTALDQVFAKLKGHPLTVPVFIAQHMPAMFTEFLAKRLSEISGHPAHEARHGENVRPGVIYVAPGDYHMTVVRSPDMSNVTIRIDQGPKRNSVRPAVDNLFESLARAYGGTCAAFVLTGMGEDGMVGAKEIKAASGGVMIQDQNTSVVWGMPGAVFAAGAYDSVGSLDECASVFLKMVG